MATTSDYTNVILECDNCQQRVSQPQVLKCLHKFCTLCLSQQGGSNNIICPCCDNSSNQRYAIVDEKLCGLCNRPMVTSYCTDCELELCEICRMSHIKIPSCIDHNVISVKDFQRRGSTLSRNCKKHRANLSKYNCIQCNVVICAECKIEAQDSHPVETVKQSFENVVAQTREHVHIITHHKKLIQKRLGHILELKEQCETQRDQIVQQIDFHKRNIIGKVQNDCESLTEAVASRSDLKIKELDMMKTDLENNLYSLEDVLQIGSSVISKHDSKGVVEYLCELQNGLFEKIKSSANDLPFGKNETINLLDMQFNPKPSLENVNTIGYMTIEDNCTELRPNLLEMKIPPALKPKPKVVKPDRKLVKSIGGTADSNWMYQHKVKLQKMVEPRCIATTESFRVTRTDLRFILNRPLHHTTTFRMDKSCGRLCYFQQNFWCPCYKESEDCIDIYDTNGKKLKTIKHLQIINPVSIHPSSTDTLLVAASNGLFLISSTGQFLQQILQGKFSDVHVCDDKIVVLEKNKDTNDAVYVLQNTNPPRHLSKFPLENNFSRMVVMNSHYIFVSFYKKSAKLSHIIQYSHTHESLFRHGKYGSKLPREMDLSIPCIMDTQGSLLVVDSKNKRIQLLYNQDEWFIIKQKILPKDSLPLDVVISNKLIFILCWDPAEDSYCIRKYNIS